MYRQLRENVFIVLIALYYKHTHIIIDIFIIDVFIVDFCETAECCVCACVRACSSL